MTVATREIQLARLRGAPPLVTHLAQGSVGAWIVGSRADFTQEPREGADWDLVVPSDRWSDAAIILYPYTQYGSVKSTRFGGLRIVVESVTVDVWPGDVAELLTRPFVAGAWHPKSGTVLIQGGL